MNNRGEKELPNKEYFSERIINIDICENKIHSAHVTANNVVDCLLEKNYDRAINLAKALSLALHELDEFEFVIEKRKMVDSSSPSGGRISNENSKIPDIDVKLDGKSIFKYVSKSETCSVKPDVGETITAKKAITQTELNQAFARGPLLNLLSAANKNIVDCIYIEEYVYVQMANGYNYRIRVAADSLMQLAADVIKFSKYR